MSIINSIFKNIGSSLSGSTNIGDGGIIANLPPLRTGGGAEGSNIDPTLRPYLGMGLQRAEQLFFGQNQPQLFPGQMYVSPAQQTLDALAQQEQIARGESAPLSAAQSAFLSGIQTPSAAMPLYQDLYTQGGQQAGADVFRQAAAGEFRNVAMDPTMQTASGAFLMGSPYQQALINQSVRPIAQQLGEVTLPGIQSAFSQAGRYGSGAQQRAIGEAVERASRAAGDVATQIGFGTYGTERGFQEAARAQLAGLSQQDIANRLAGAGTLAELQQAAFGRQAQAAGGIGATQAADLQRQLAASQLAPQIYAQQFLPSEQLAQLGASREAIAAKPLQEEISRFQFGQQLPYSQLQSYLSAVYGNPMSSGVTPQQAPAQVNRLGSSLGGAALGAGIGQAIGGSFGGLSAPVLGAGLGGLAGLLF
jgi:hypothetical protein